MADKKPSHNDPKQKPVAPKQGSGGGMQTGPASGSSGDKKKK